MTGTLHARRVVYRPIGPRGDLIEDSPAWTVFVAVGAYVGAVVTRVEPQACDDDENVRGRGGARVDRHAPPRSGLTPVDVVLGERVVCDDFRKWPDPGPVEHVVHGAGAVLFGGSQWVGMPTGAVGEVLQLVAGNEHRLNGGRHAGRDQRYVSVVGSELGAFAGDEAHGCGGLTRQAAVCANRCFFTFAAHSLLFARLALTRRAAVARGPFLHLCHIPACVVVGEDRLAVVAGGAGSAQIVGSPVDRVRRIPPVSAAVAVAVDAIPRPC